LLKEPSKIVADKRRSSAGLAALAWPGRRLAECRPSGDTWRHLSVRTRATAAPTAPPTEMTAVGAATWAAARPRGRLLPGRQPGPR
jgi:hypothetical protein